ncbi:sacsin-like isoform X2 [Dreissena polymorpha]|uniref:sacsin-like isoform X2 n=1 Tax=Dreissena polymorpha TaxID=45954 RepID=UPI002264567D|nr:sacsin-like isoform X2 [Dreissena polymorpha]
MTERSILPLDWLRLVWSSISPRGIGNFVDIPIFPVLLSGSFESKYQVKLVALQNSDLLLKHERTGNRYTCIDDDVEQSLRLLEITVITQLPRWLSHDLINKFVVRPSIEDVKKLLQMKARSIDQQRIHAFNKDATMSNRSRLLDLLALFGPIDGDLVYLLQKLRLFRSIKRLGNCVAVDSHTHYVRESEQGKFPENIEFPENCVLVKGNEETVAKQLNCKKLTLDIFMRVKLAVPKFDMSKTENKNVMIFFLKNIESFTALVDCVSEMRFIRDTTGRLVKPSEIFDPFDEFLCRLFYGEDVFPAAKDALRPHRDALIKLGMKRYNSIMPENIFIVAKTIDSVVQFEDKINDKAKALQEYIENNPGVLRQTLMLGKSLGDEIKGLSCFVYCTPEECEWHDRLPQLLKWFSTKNRVCCPTHMKEIKFWPLICSSMPIIKTRSTELSSFFGWNIPPSAKEIILQLKSIQQCSISSDVMFELLTVLKTIYQALSLQSTPVVREAIVSNALVWTADNFQDPAKVIVKQVEDDIELKPYMYFLPSELGSLHTFFTWLGCHSRQDQNVLVSVLQCMQTKYLSRKFSQAETKKDFKCAQMILERLAEADIDSSWASDNILVVVHSNSDHTIKFAKLSECVYEDDPACSNDVVDGESIYYVHEQIPFSTIEKLGVKSVTGLSLADAQDFDHWGQRESFTTRLRSLLRDGYTDGLSVPKELLQNADDAGATELCFVYDERKHSDSRERLISKSLADFQGSALWCYNNKVFSEKDLQNIKRFNDSAKVDDLSTIGKFGLGFNAVYNITDIPSFISGADMLIFDPHEKYLIDPLTKKTTRGKRIPLSKRTLVKRHTDQFKPFQDMFGCNVLNDPFTRYQGTLFRFPLRTAQQADMSEICKTVYSHNEVLCLLKMFMNSAEQLLLFCQNVSSIKLYHISADAVSANDMKIMYTVRKESIKLTDEKCTSFQTGILAKAVSVHKQQRGSCIEEHHSITIRQTFFDNATLFPKVNWPKSDVKSTWLITWVLQYRPSHLETFDAIPLVAVATLCKTENDLTPQALEKKPVEDCNSGHIFCFLPLPITTGFSFHINGCFIVTDDRQRLVLMNEDDKKGGSRSAADTWNTYLLQYPLVKALVRQIQKTQHFCQTQEDAYRLWPRNCKPDVTPLVNSFYREIVDHHIPIFSDRGNCLPFNQILILTEHPETQVFKYLLHFLMHVPFNKYKTVVDVPDYVCKNIRWYNNDRKSIIENAFISMPEALLHFLHNISDTYWTDKLITRNNLLAHAIMVADADMKICLRTLPCIPTAPNGRLRCVLDLIHPHSKLSKLFSESDERFITKCESLNCPKIHVILTEYGMNSLSLPSELIIDRCRSLETLSKKCVICTKQRLRFILTYLAESKVPQEIVDQLQHLNILPILHIPRKWTFTWKGKSLEHEVFCSGIVKCSKHVNEISQSLVLGHPCTLFRMHCRHCVGSVQYIVDETDSISPQLLNDLSVKDNKDLTIDLLMEQLNVVGDEFESGKGRFTGDTRKIIDEVYKALDCLTINMSKDELQRYLYSDFSLTLSKPIIAIDEVLVSVGKVARYTVKSCPPDLYGLPKVSVSRWRILEKLGVHENFSVADVLGVLKLKTEDNNKEIQLNLKSMVGILENLANCMNREGKTHEDLKEFEEYIIAPDREGRFCPANQLALEDNVMTTKTKLRLLHEDVSPYIGKVIGVRSKRFQLLKQCTHAIPFGQREELTTRLNGLLKDYPSDEIMYELIQNADDAGACEIHFIKYFEQKQVGKSLEHGQILQPALCIYNTSCFTERDFQGIQKLGIGSKADDPSKTGQFGLGFNAVYHVTDFPSFLTKGPNLGENGQVCMFDPLLTHIRDILDGEPGIRYNVDDLNADFPDTTIGFPTITGSCGTMFRLPLRQEESKISKSCFTLDDVDILLEKFISVMPNCMHFLRHIRKMKISRYENGDYVDEYVVESEITNKEDRKQQCDFFKEIHTLIESNIMHDDMFNANPLDVAYKMRIHDTRGVDTTWLIVHQFGSIRCEGKDFHEMREIFRQEELRFLPTGGVSIQLCSKNVRESLKPILQHVETEHKSAKLLQTFQLPPTGSTYGHFPQAGRHTQSQTANGNLYCFLPLPGKTGLPFNVNGHFSVDRARRGLLEDGYRQKWNNFLLSFIVTEALIKALKYLQKYWIEENTDILLEKVHLKSCLCIYFSHFPRHEIATDGFWKYFVEEFYRVVIEKQIQLFPVILEHEVQTVPTAEMRYCIVEWIHLATNLQSLDGGVADTLHLFWENKESHDESCIRRVLGRMAIQVSSTDLDVVATMNKAGQTNVIKTDPLVLAYLVKGLITTLNCNLQGTVLENIDTAHSFLKYLLLNEKFDDEIEALPLCITNNCILRKFKTDNPIFCSEYFEILSGSFDRFVHSHLVYLLKREKLFEANVLARFTLHEFIDLLPLSFRSDVFCKNDAISWQNSDPNPVEPVIVRRIFEFILQESKESEHFGDSRKLYAVFKENIRLISHWSFLPSKTPVTGGFNHELIPINRAYSLLSNASKHELRTILSKINIPTVDKDVLKITRYFDQYVVVDAVKSMISSPSKPDEFLKCLHYHKIRIKNCKLTVEEADHILRIFSQNITVLSKTFKDEAKQLLKEIPLYASLQNQMLVSLDDSTDIIVLTNTIPCGGLHEWASRQGKIIVNENIHLEDLYNYLGLPYRNELEMYLKHIFPSIYMMPSHFWLSHIRHIKDNVLTVSIGKGFSTEQNQLIQMITNLPFIEVNGNRYRANQLFDRTHPVFEAMVGEDMYLPEEYMVDGWKPFMKTIGFNVGPSGSMMINYARTLARNGAMGITAPLIHASNVLVSCLLGKYGDTFEDDVLLDLKTTRFVVPFTIDNEMSRIYRGNSPTNLFISFSGSCISQRECLCWTSLPLVHFDSDQHKMNLLEIALEPNVDSVITHCQNICHEFQNDFERNVPQFNNKAKYMEIIYSFLMRKRQVIKVERLHDTPFILISDETMIKASSVFIWGQEGSEIKPYLYSLPENLLSYGELFKLIGSPSSPTCMQYANVLAAIKYKFGNEAIPHYAMEMVRKAIKYFFDLLGTVDVKRISTVLNGISCLFLPNTHRILSKSTELIIPDNSVYRQALGEICNLNIFLGFNEMELRVPPSTFERLKKFPEHLKPSFLTEVVIETVSTVGMVELTDSPDALCYEQFLHCNDFFVGLRRLLNHENNNECSGESSCTDDEILYNTLLNARITEVIGLRTLLSYNERIVDEVSLEKDYCVKQNEIESRSGVPVYHLYYQKQVPPNPVNKTSRLHAGLTLLIENCTGGRLSKYSVMLLQEMLYFNNDPGQITRFLDKNRIPPLDDSNTNMLFPEVGTYVEDGFYPFLVQQIAPFRVHEYRYVALLIDIEDDESALEQSDIRYIYAHILQQMNIGSSSTLSIRYRVNVGLDHGGIIEVPLFRLFKFLPQNVAATSNAVVVYDIEPIGLIHFDENSERIRDMLQEAFQLFEIQDRRRIIHRLLLRWHPDRNAGHEDYATRVFNFIQHLILRLERNEELNIDAVAGPPNMSVSRYYNTFANANTTGHVYTSGFRENIEEYNKSNRQGRYVHGALQRAAVKRPGEYRRWIKQAKHDFRTGEMLLNCKEHHPKTYNWICYNCHQACEKALKAAWFMKDANRCPRKEHRLTSIASGLDSVIATEARTFERLFIEGKDYLTLRYPDCVQSDKIPSEVFTAEHAEFAVATARKILKMVEELSR